MSNAVCTGQAMAGPSFTQFVPSKCCWVIRRLSPHCSRYATDRPVLVTWIDASLVTVPGVGSQTLLQEPGNTKEMVTPCADVSGDVGSSLQALMMVSAVSASALAMIVLIEVCILVQPCGDECGHCCTKFTMNGNELVMKGVNW